MKYLNRMQFEMCWFIFITVKILILQLVFELSGAVVSRMDYRAGDPGLIPAGAEFPTGIQFWVMA